MNLLTRVRVVNPREQPGRHALLGYEGVVERVATHAGVTIYWVRMDEKLPEGFELHEPLEARHRWVLVDPEEVVAL